MKVKYEFVYYDMANNCNRVITGISEKHPTICAENGIVTIWADNVRHVINHGHFLMYSSEAIEESEKTS